MAAAAASAAEHAGAVRAATSGAAPHGPFWIL